MVIADRRASRCLIVFTKPARPGRVKTRLIGELSPVQAAQLHAAFLEDLLETMKSGEFMMEIAWSLESMEQPPDIGIAGFRQASGDLGEKLYRGLSRVASRFDYVAAVGSDHPDLPRDRVEEAFRRLEKGADLVIGPAVDGGYYLVAARSERLEADLFRGIEWSTERVLSATLEKCRRKGLVVELLSEGEDVDTPEDLRRLAMRIESRTVCPGTRRLLEAWGLLPVASHGRSA